MRRILVDHARTKLATKRGGEDQKLSLDDGTIDVRDERAAEMVALDDALRRLADVDPEKSRVVELRYFGGLSMGE